MEPVWASAALHARRSAVSCSTSRLLTCLFSATLPPSRAPPLPRPALPAAAAKLDEISRKISVLSSFTEPDATPEVPAAAAAAKVPVTTPAEDSEDGEEEVYADGLDEGADAGGLSWQVELGG